MLWRRLLQILVPPLLHCVLGRIPVTGLIEVRSRHIRTRIDSRKVKLMRVDLISSANKQLFAYFLDAWLVAILTNVVSMLEAFLSE